MTPRHRFLLIWCPKHRRALGEADVWTYLEAAFRATAEECGFWIEEVAIESDHVHVFLGFPSKHAIARIVGILKSISASRTFHQFPWLRRKYWSGELLEDGYVVRMVGDRVTTYLIRRYIKRHTEEQTTNQPELFCATANEDPPFGRGGSLRWFRLCRGGEAVETLACADTADGSAPFEARSAPPPYPTLRCWDKTR